MDDILDTHVHIEETLLDVYVEDLPPSMQTPLDVRQAIRLKDLTRKLKEMARSTYLGVFPTDHRVTLQIRYQRANGSAEAADVIGGIASALEKVVLDNGRLVTEVYYAEQRGNMDAYWVKVTCLREEHAHEHGHPH